MPHCRSRYLAVGEEIIIQVLAEELPVAGRLLDWDEFALVVGNSEYARLVPWSAVQSVSASEPDPELPPPPSLEQS